MLIAVGLGLAYLLHVCRLSVFSGNNHARIIDKSLGNLDTFQFLGKDLFPPISEGGEDLSKFLESLSFKIIIIGEFEVTLSDVG